MCGGVVGGDELIDFGHQVFDAAEAASSDGLLRDEVKPDLHLIEPGGVGWRIVEVITGAGRQPLFHLWMFMGAIVIDDEVKIKGRIPDRREIEKLLADVQLA